MNVTSHDDNISTEVEPEELRQLRRSRELLSHAVSHLSFARGALVSVSEARDALEVAGFHEEAEQINAVLLEVTSQVNHPLRQIGWYCTQGTHLGPSLALFRCSCLEPPLPVYVVDVVAKDQGETKEV